MGCDSGRCDKLTKRVKGFIGSVKMRLFILKNEEDLAMLESNRFESSKSSFLQSTE